MQRATARGTLAWETVKVGSLVMVTGVVVSSVVVVVLLCSDVVCGVLVMAVVVAARAMKVFEVVICVGVVSV